MNKPPSEVSRTGKSLALVACLVLAFTLGGCGTTSVMSVGPSTYQVASSHGSLDGSFAKSETQAHQKAEAFCAQRGLIASVVNDHETGVPGWSPQTATLTFTCGPNLQQVLERVKEHCRRLMTAPGLDPIHGKVDFLRAPEQAPSFDVAANDAYPTAAERQAIRRWGELRQQCIAFEHRMIPEPTNLPPLELATYQQDQSYFTDLQEQVGDLIVLLYQGKLTYGQFAQKRYQVGREAMQAERAFRTASLAKNQDLSIHAQQLAAEQERNRIAAWQAYVQQVQAFKPPPAQIYVSPTVHTNCMPNGLGGLNCTSN